MSVPHNEAPELAGKTFVAAEHSGLEINHMADGGHAPEVVPNSYYAAGQEKAAADAYYAQQQGQWGHEGAVPPQYSGTAPPTGYEHGSPQSQHTYGYSSTGQYNGGGDGYSSATPAGAPIGDENPKRRLCGIPRKRALILIVVAIVAVIAIAVGVGVGVSVGSNKRNSSDPTTPSQTTASTTTATSAAATASSTPIYDAVGCPGANQLKYTTPDGKNFIRYCNLDFGTDNSDSKALITVKTHTMTECMDQCGDTDGCQGAGWGWLDGDKDNLHNCYMKTDLKRAHTAIPAWNFAVLQPTNLTTSDLAGGGSN